VRARARARAACGCHACLLFVRSRKALQLNRNNAQLAMEWLLEHEDDADADTPLTPAEFAR
jgi:uncharacterized UBP type Zn finger protein